MKHSTNGRKKQAVLTPDFSAGPLVLPTGTPLSAELLGHLVEIRRRWGERAANLLLEFTQNPDVPIGERVAAVLASIIDLARLAEKYAALKKADEVPPTLAAAPAGEHGHDAGVDSADASA